MTEGETTSTFGDRSTSSLNGGLTPLKNDKKRKEMRHKLEGGTGLNGGGTLNRQGEKFHRRTSANDGVDWGMKTVTSRGRSRGEVVQMVETRGRDVLKTVPGKEGDEGA